MSDSRSHPSPPEEPPSSGTASAGAWLREAREAAGMSIEAVAATLKLPPQTLRALEADDHAALRDAVFVRALAQSVCRALQRDPAVVLSMLPRATMRGPKPLSDRDVIRSTDGRFQRRERWSASVFTPLTALLGLIALGALAVAWVPDAWLPWSDPTAGAAGTGAPAVVVEPPLTLPTGAPAAFGAAPESPPTPPVATPVSPAPTPAPTPASR